MIYVYLIIVLYYYSTFLLLISQEAEKVLEDKDHKKELREHAAYSLDKLKLSEPNKIGYTYKAFGAGFYGLRKSRKKRFRDIILKVIMEAGDADRCALFM